jgi:hypothetical protein
VCVCSRCHPAWEAHAPYYICILSAVVCLALPHFFHLISYTGTIFGTQVLLNMKYVFWFSVKLLSETFLNLRRILLDIYITIQRSTCRVPVIVVMFYWNTNFLDTDFRKILKCKLSSQNPSSGSRVVPCRWTDTTNLTIAFQNFANAPKNKSMQVFFFLYSINKLIWAITNITYLVPSGSRAQSQQWTDTVTIYSHCGLHARSK